MKEWKTVEEKERERENGRWTDGRTWMCGSCWIGERIYDRLIDFIIVFLRKQLSACEITDWPKRLEHVTSRAKKRKRREKSNTTAQQQQQRQRQQQKRPLTRKQSIAAKQKTKKKNQSDENWIFKRKTKPKETQRETLLLLFLSIARFFLLFLFSLTKNLVAANWRSTAQNQPSANCYLHSSKRK